MNTNINPDSTINRIREIFISSGQSIHEGEYLFSQLTNYIANQKLKEQQLSNELKASQNLIRELHMHIEQDARKIEELKQHIEILKNEKNDLARKLEENQQVNEEIISRICNRITQNFIGSFNTQLNPVISSLNNCIQSLKDNCSNLDGIKNKVGQTYSGLTTVAEKIDKIHSGIFDLSNSMKFAIESLNSNKTDIQQLMREFSNDRLGNEQKYQALVKLFSKIPSIYDQLNRLNENYIIITRNIGDVSNKMRAVDFDLGNVKNLLMIKINEVKNDIMEAIHNVPRNIPYESMIIRRSSLYDYIDKLSNRFSKDFMIQAIWGILFCLIFIFFYFFYCFYIVKSNKQVSEKECFSL